jgi:cell division protein FtsB
MFKILFHPFSLVIATIIVVLLWLSLWANTREIKQSQDFILTLQNKVENEKKEVSHLEEKLNQADSDTQKERLIRDELLMQKPGEYVIQVPEVPISEEKVQETQKITTPWEEWRTLLF